MAQEISLTREEPIQALGEFSSALTETLARAGLGADKAWAARAAVLAECVQCGMSISGEELFALSQPEPQTETNAKVRRLRLGDCARPGCESYHYRLTFQTCAAVDWATLVPQIDRIKGELQLNQTRASAAIKRKALWAMARRVAIALALVIVLFLIRQWYFGGRIPLLREPEQFRVDPFPADYQPPQ